jgi:hypothetical protein
MASRRDQTPFGSSVIRASGKRSLSDDGFDLLGAGQDTSFELEVAEAVSLVGGLGLPDDRFRRQRLLVPDPVPVHGRIGYREDGELTENEVAWQYVAFTLRLVGAA